MGVSDICRRVAELSDVGDIVRGRGGHNAALDVSTAFCARAQTWLGCELPVETFLDAPTVRQLAAVLEQIESV